MAKNTLETRKKKESYEIRKDDEIILYFRKDVFPRWFIRSFWIMIGSILTGVVSYLVRILTQL